MEENETELLRLIYTRLGMAREDASIVAIELGSPSSRFDPDEVEGLKQELLDISALTDVAQSIAK